MIPILPATAWREFRGEAKQKGLNKTTHQAMIEDPSGKWHRCYVKGCPSDWPSPLTEALGWLLAEALDLPRPEFAALVMVPLDKLRSHMTLDQHWLKQPEMLAFCASSVDGKTPSHSWQWVAHMRSKRLYKRLEVARIGAFDYWVENRDRNTGNLIVKKDGDCVPIDNEFILYSLLWNSMPFTVNHNSLFLESKKYLSHVEYSRFTVEMARQAKQHEPALLAASPKLQSMVMSLVDPARAAAVWTSIEQFLGARSGPDWLSNELGVIA